MKEPAWLKQLSPLDALLICVPLTPVAVSQHWDTAAFLFSCLAIIPLAGLMGKATEYLAERVGEGLGGFLNATFGNACELIIAFAALRAGMQDIVKASLTGSIIGNILLVLGASMLAGGLKHESLLFNRTAATTSATLLALAAISLTVPAIFHGSARALHNEDELALGIAVILFITYICSLVFSLKTHKHHYTSAPPIITSATQIAGPGAAADALANVPPGTPLSPTGNGGNIAGVAGGGGETVQVQQAETAPAYAFAVAPKEPNPNIDPDAWRTRTCLIVLGIATAIVAWLSEVLVHTVEHAAVAMHMNRLFIGMVLIAIIGNAAEHSTAVLMARKGKMDLAMGIALGSGAQIALFVAPLLVFASYFFGPAPMDLNFTPFEVLSVTVSVIVLAFVATDGECNWLEGVQLLAVYGILGIAFFFAA
jgi:Ca2+:H+ antiporter